MKIWCKHPSEIQDVNTLKELETAVECDGHPIARYVFCAADLEATFNFQPRVFPANLNIKTGKKLEPITSVELSYANDVVVMGRNGLIKAVGDQAIAFLHPFYTTDKRIYDQVDWSSAYVRRMRLQLSNLKPIGPGELSLLKPITISRTIETPVFLFGTASDESYSHYVWDTLPQLWYLQQLRDLDVKILVDEKLDGYKKEFLLALGFDDQRIITRSLNEHILCKKIYMGTRLSVNNRMVLPQGLELLNQLRIPKTEQSRRIFLDRDDDHKATRKLLNEEDLWSICKQFGFERLTPGRMSLSEKQLAFSQAEIIVGQYGGGLQNHYLCYPQTRLVILQSDLFQRNIFDYTSDTLKLPIISIFGRAFHTGFGSPNNSNFMIDEHIFKQVLTHMVSPRHPVFLKLLSSNRSGFSHPEDLKIYRLQIRLLFNFLKNRFFRKFRRLRHTKK